jgi:hypothetical protein
MPLAVGGCAEGVGVDPAVMVERTHSLPPRPPATAFVVNALTRGQTADPAFQTAANIVGALLERRGHPWLNNDQGYSAPWKVTLEPYMTPLPGASPMPGAHTPLAQGAGPGGGWAPAGGALGLSASVPDPNPTTLVEKRLTLTIQDNGRTVYQGRAVLYDQNRDLAKAMGPLARALFQDFPGPQGMTQTLDHTAGTGDLRRHGH